MPNSSPPRRPPRDHHHRPNYHKFLHLFPSTALINLRKSCEAGAFAYNLPQAHDECGNCLITLEVFVRRRKSREATD